MKVNTLIEPIQNFIKIQAIIIILSIIQKYMKNIVGKKWNRVIEYDWRKDQIFSESINKYNNSMGRTYCDGFSKGYSDFLEIQMLYVILWTALVRFLTFRYGKSKDGMW